MKLNINLKWSPGLAKISRLLLNKYLFATTVFVVWLIFFDRSSFLTQWSLSRTIANLEEEKEFLIQETEATRLLEQDILNNKEKYAREKYYMKKPGEQIFIID